MSDHEGMDDQHQQQASPTQGPDGTFVAHPETARRDAQAAELRGKGWGYRKIAAELSIDVHTAHDAVQRALRAIRAEGAAEARTLELERLDATLDRLAALQLKVEAVLERHQDRKSTRLNSSHQIISYAVFCL